MSDFLYLEIEKKLSEVRGEKCMNCIRAYCIRAYEVSLRSYDV